MRILCVCYEDMGGYIGGVRQVIEINKSLSEKGHQIEICAPAIRRYKKEVPFKINYIPTIRKRILQPIIYHLVSFFYLFYNCVRFKPEVVFTFEVFFTCIPMVVAKFFHLPYVVFVNGDTEDFKVQGMPGFFLFFIDLIRNINFRFSDKVVTINETLKQMLIDRYNINPNRISIANNGVDIDVFKPLDKREICEDLGLDSQTLYVGFLGGIFPWHGLDNLVRAASFVLAKHPEVKFIIAGHGPNKEDLIRLSEELKIREKFIFYDSVPFDSVPKYMNIFDIAVLFFAEVRKSMGDPIKLYEYLACGKPIVASNIPGYGEFIEKIQSGISVDSNNPSSIAEAIIKLIEDKELRDKYSSNAREIVVDNFTWAHTAAKVENYIKEAKE